MHGHLTVFLPLDPIGALLQEKIIAGFVYKAPFITDPNP